MACIACRIVCRAAANGVTELGITIFYPSLGVVEEAEVNRDSRDKLPFFHHITTRLQVLNKKVLLDFDKRICFLAETVRLVSSWAQKQNQVTNNMLTDHHLVAKTVRYTVAILEKIETVRQNCLLKVNATPMQLWIGNAYGIQEPLWELWKTFPILSSNIFSKISGDSINNRKLSAALFSLSALYKQLRGRLPILLLFNSEWTETHRHDGNTEVTLPLERYKSPWDAGEGVTVNHIETWPRKDNPRGTSTPSRRSPPHKTSFHKY